MDLQSLTGLAHASARAARPSLAALALEERNAAIRELRAHGSPGAGKSEFQSVAEWLADLASRTLCLTLLAGSGSRWVKSLTAAKEAPAAGRPSWYDPDFDEGLPRGLYPVKDYLRAKGGRIAIAAYAFAALRGLGRHLVVVRGHEGEIDSAVLAPIGIGPDNRVFFTQAAPFGKPLGHGDAAWQCSSFFQGADYVVTNFGGDANSRTTALSSLLVLDALAARSAAGGCPRVDLLMPAARILSPAYPIVLGKDGLPERFGHAKLQGQATAEGEAYTNVGLRLYRAPALLARLGSFHQRFWVDGEGYAIPGNDPEGHEFALDNVDAELASEGLARVLAISAPRELTPAKSLEDIPAFEKAIEEVVAEDRRLAV